MRGAVETPRRSSGRIRFSRSYLLEPSIVRRISTDKRPSRESPTIRQVIGQFWGCERKGDFSIVVPLGGKRRDSQRKKVLNSPRNRQTSLSVEAQTLYGLFFTLFRSA